MLESQLPIGYVLEYAIYQPDLVEAAVNGGLNNVYQTIAIVLAVVMIFLGVRTGLIVGSFVPLTMLMRMMIMRMLGIEFERVSIASPIIALGMLVDAVAAIVLGGFIASQLVRKFFGPSTDRNEFLVYVDLPAGYRLDSTDETVQRLNAWLNNRDINPEITGTVAYVGFGGPRFFLVLSPVQPNPHVAFMVVRMEKAEQIPEVMRRLRQRFLDDIPEAAGRVKQMWMGSAEPGFVEVRLPGPDAEVLYQKGNQLVDGLRAMPGTLDVRHDWENKVPRAKIVVDQVRARSAGITSRDVALWLQTHMDGLDVTEYREGDIAIPVRARSVGEHRSGLGDLWNVKVTSSRTGKVVPLTQIADIQVESDFYRISRRSQESCLTVELKHELLRAPELFAATKPLIEALQLAPDYRWEVGGEIEQGAETMGRLMQWMPICVFGILVLLIWQFNSFRRPLIIFITIPLAFTGGFIGLLIMQAPFYFFAMLGLLSLAGVIINNGIVLIDKIDSDRAAGAEPYAAVVGAALSRFRPILMTTVTTVFGLLPLIISLDPLFFSMAVILAFGLLFGTILTLGVVPALYAVLFRVKAG